jgi:hypothetical protein
METMDSLNFDKEDIIDSKLSTLTFMDDHGLSPESLSKKKNVIVLYENVTILNGIETVYDFIVSVQNDYYIYLKRRDGGNYAMKIYYNYNNRQQINLLLSSLKNARN